MNKTFKAFILITVLSFFFSCVKKGNSKASVNNNNYVEMSLDSCGMKKVVGFLNWYKRNIDSIYQIQFVKVEPNKPYRIDYKEANRFFSVLKNSGFFSDFFIQDLLKYFKKRDEIFEKNRQSDGPPWGFSSDLFLYCQDYIILFDNIEKLNFKIVHRNSNDIRIEMTYKNEYDLIFNIDKNCQIEKIVTVLTDPTNGKRTEMSLDNANL